MLHDDFLNLARELDKDALSLAEAKKRTATSRAYYYILIKIRDTLENCGHYFNKSIDSHKEVIDRLLPIDGSMASRLSSLRTKRNDADYDFKCSKFSKESSEAELAIGEAVSLNYIFENTDKEKLKPHA